MKFQNYELSEKFRNTPPYPQKGGNNPTKKGKTQNKRLLTKEEINYEQTLIKGGFPPKNNTKNEKHKKKEEIPVEFVLKKNKNQL